MIDLNYLTAAYLRNYRRRLSAAWEINYGDCMRYAAITNKLHGGQLVSISVMVEDTDADYLQHHMIANGSHAFVLIDGKYYDAESPQGEDDWHQLKYFTRLDLSLYTYWEYQVRWHPSARSFTRFWRPRKNLLKADKRLLSKIIKEIK